MDEGGHASSGFRPHTVGEEGTPAPLSEIKARHVTAVRTWQYSIPRQVTLGCHKYIMQKAFRDVFLALEPNWVAPIRGFKLAPIGV